VDAADGPARADRQPAGPDRAVGVLAALEALEALSRLFGFVQFDFAGRLGVPDGRYLAREAGGVQRVLVIETAGAPSPSGRRRRRARDAAPDAEPSPLPLAKATAVRAQEPFDSAEEAQRWLEAAVASEDSVDALLDEGIALLNRALHAAAAASADPLGAELGRQHATLVRIGYGSGEEVAAGRFTQARHVDPRAGTSRRRLREEELRPQERLAAVLGGRERIDASETLLLRARADLDAGRHREAALQLRVALEALLIELDGALTDPAHEEDMAELSARRKEVGDAANAALRGDLDPERERQIEELILISERVLRRRRVLRG
jgi:hypothetical protein